MPDGIRKQGAAAIDEIVMGMQLSGVDRVKQLLAGGFHQEAIKEANRLSPEDLRKLAADLQAPVTPNEVEQEESAISPPKEVVEQDHTLDENSDEGKPNSQPGETPAPENADINPVEGEDNTDESKTPRAPTQIEEEATPPGGTEEPKEEHPKTTGPDNEVSVATKQAEEGEATEKEKEEGEEGKTETETETDKEEKATEEPSEEPAKTEEEENPLKSASLQGYVKGSQDALLAIIRILQK